jgi:hypothetical protein
MHFLSAGTLVLERNGDYTLKWSHCVPFVFNKLRDKKYLICKVFIWLTYVYIYIVYLLLTKLNTMPNHFKLLIPVTKYSSKFVMQFRYQSLRVTNHTKLRKPHLSSVEMNMDVENYETCLKILTITSKETETNDSRRPHQYTSYPKDSPTRFTKLFCPYSNILCDFMMSSSSNIDSWEFDTLVGLLAKLWKAAIRFVKSVRLSVRPHGTIQNQPVGFFWYLILVCFIKSIVKFQECFKSGKKSNRHFIWNLSTFMTTLFTNITMTAALSYFFVCVQAAWLRKNTSSSS